MSATGPRTPPPAPPVPPTSTAEAVAQLRAALDRTLARHPELADRGRGLNLDEGRYVYAAVPVPALAVVVAAYAASNPAA